MNGRAGIAVWLVLVACAALIVGAMGWLTHGVMRAESERSLAESRAVLEEKIRLSLWRMDSLAATLSIEENQLAFSEGQITPAPSSLASDIKHLTRRNYFAK